MTQLGLLRDAGRGCGPDRRGSRLVLVEAKKAVTAEVSERASEELRSRVASADDVNTSNTRL